MAAVPVLDESRFGYLKPTDVARLAEAYRFSGAAHAGQTRQSGEPYVSHPLAVAEILAGWHLDSQALMAALLHDVMEDTSVTKAEISDTFGKPVADLVDGVSKLDKIEFQSAEDAQAENFRKMLLAMARDVRVILIKLADRLHNMRTLAAVAPAGRVVVCGATSGPNPPAALHRFWWKQLDVLGSTMGTREDFLGVYDLVRKGRARVHVDRVFPLSEIQAAHERLEAGDQLGKIVLSIPG